MDRAESANTKDSNTMGQEEQRYGFMVDGRRSGRKGVDATIRKQVASLG